MRARTTPAFQTLTLVPTGTAAVAAALSLLAIASAAALAATATAARAQTVVDTCGQSVAGDAVLVGDLDCSLAPLPSVTFTSPGVLDLAGFTLTGEVFADVQGFTVRGPGTITGPGDGIRSAGSLLHGPHIRIVDASISGNAGTGINIDADEGNRPSVQLDGATIDGNGGDGVTLRTTADCCGTTCTPGSKARVKNSSISGNAGTALSAINVVVQSSAIDANGVGVELPAVANTRKLKFKESSASGNTGAGIYLADGGRLKAVVIGATLSSNGDGVLDETGASRSILQLKGATMDANGTGVRVIGAAADASVKASATQITNSTFDGVAAESAAVRVALRMSTVTGAGSDGDCGVGRACADLHTGSAPDVSADSDCGTSHQAGSGVPGTSWGACSSD